MYAIQVCSVSKKYKNGVQALDRLNLTVKEGELFSLLGQNGAGKSTLIKVLTTFLRPASGAVTVLGKDIYKEAPQIRSQIACVAQQTSIDTYLSLEENMLFQSRLHKIPKAEAVQRMEDLIAAFELSRFRNYPVASYSGGVKRRLDLALNMMSKPKILFLDEPTVGMDVQSRRAMWDMMKKIRGSFGTTIFLTTHYLDEADALSDTVCIIKDGKEIIQGTPDTLHSLIRDNTLQIKFISVSDADKSYPRLKEKLSETDLSKRDSVIIVRANSCLDDLNKVTALLLSLHIPFIGIEIAQATLEDVFLRLTQDKKEERVWASQSFY